LGGFKKSTEDITPNFAVQPIGILEFMKIRTFNLRAALKCNNKGGEIFLIQLKDVLEHGLWNRFDSAHKRSLAVLE
jgi:hypothetical protein